MAENFRGRKQSRFGTKREFCRENFRGLLRSNYNVGVATTFAEKTFTDGSETAKNEKSFPPQKFSPSKVFSLKSFPPYGILWTWISAYRVCEM